jgi:DNA recombination protein RmuC
LTFDLATFALALAVGLVVGSAVAWAIAGQRARSEADVASERLRIESSARAALAARLEEQQKAFLAERALLQEAERRLGDTFKALSADALRASSASFLQLAGQALEKYQESARGDLERRQQALRQSLGFLQNFA